MPEIDKATIIIGGGPGGASAAIYLARACMPVILIDAPGEVHGRTAMATGLDNYLGLEEPVTGKEFLRRVRKQLSGLDIVMVEEKVIEARKNNGQFEVLTDRGEEYRGKYLIVAVGLSDNMPPIKGLEPYFDTAIFHCTTCDWYTRRDKRIAVITNSDAGIRTALGMAAMKRPPYLAVVAGEDNVNFSEELIEKAEEQGILVYGRPIKELMGENGYLQAIKLADGTKLEVEVLFTRLGYERLDGFLSKGGIEAARNKAGFIKVDWRTMESSVPNLFAVGPCNDGPDQVIIAGGEGALAALEIRDRIMEKMGV